MAHLFLCVVLLTIATFAYAGQHISTDLDDYICSAQGRFSDPIDTTCKRYHLCSPGRRGVWVRSSYSCPNGTIFDKNIGVCTSNSRCHHQSYEPDLPSDYEDGDFVCRHPGLHDDKLNPYCSGYYECKTNHKSALFPVQRTCPPPSKFDPIARRCTNQYKCNREFRCSSVGRFDDGGDEYNKRYFLCSRKNNGDYVKSVYSCPLYSRFIEESSRCGIPDEIAEDELDIHDHTLPIEDWENQDGFVCKKRGYSAMPISLKMFYFCDVLSDGELAKYILSCQHGYLFDDDTNLCSPAH